MTAADTCSQGSTRNWQPGDTIDDYLQNCREGLETYSESRVAKLLGMSRVRLYRAKMMAKIPESLFELLLVQLPRRPSTKELAAIGRWLADGNAYVESERCPNCGHHLRTRRPWSKDAQRIVGEWLEAGHENSGVPL